MLPLDFSEIPKITTAKPTIFQKLALFAELFFAVLLPVGVLFKIESWPYAAEMLVITLLGLASIYFAIPALLFRSRHIGGHILSYITGFLLSIVLIGVLFKIESWPYAFEMIFAAGVGLMPLFVILAIILAINFKDTDKRNLYLRIGLRLLVIFLFVKF